MADNLICGGPWHVRCGIDVSGTIQTHDDYFGFEGAGHMQDFFARHSEFDEEFRLKCGRGVLQSQLLELFEFFGASILS